MMTRALLIGLAVTAAACTSPEATRVMGGGPGADTGNRAAILKMHEGSNPFEGTPDLNPTQPPPLDSATHARRRSLQ